MRRIYFADILQIKDAMSPVTLRSVGCLIETVRSGSRAIDIDNVNRVLLQPHWQKEVDLTDF